MADPFTAEIRMFGFNYAPVNWAFCNGQLLPIQSNTALFALIGNIYGGDGRTTFGLPNMQSRAPLGATSASAQGGYGEASGSEAVSIGQSEMPAHNHTLNGNILSDATQAVGTPSPSTVPTNVSSSTAGKGQKAFLAQQTPNVAFDPSSILSTGGSQPHENRQPYLAVTFCICLYGIFPPFS